MPDKGDSETAQRQPLGFQDLPCLGPLHVAVDLKEACTEMSVGHREWGDMSRVCSLGGHHADP